MKFSEMEIKAIEAMLPAMGQHVASSGIMDKPFSQCSREEILALFAATVKTFRTHLQTQIDDAGVPF